MNSAGRQDCFSLQCRFSVRWTLLLLLAGFVVASTLTQPAAAQQAPRPMPKPEYYFIFGEMYSGEYQSAGRRLRTFSNTAFRDVDGHFMDSVCYWTMLGENYYRLGDYASAIEQYDAALGLYLDLQQWPMRTQLPQSLLADSSAARRGGQVPWATTARTPNYGKFDSRMLIMLGKSDAANEAAMRGGGVVDPARYRSVDMAEVMRCVSLALYRRQQIKGPTCVIDPYTRRLSTGLVGDGGATIPAAWQGVAKGIAQAAAEDDNRAASTLQASLQIGGRDHPLTPIALLTLGKITARANNLDAAQQLFLEASICAAAYEQYDMVEESLRYATLIHAAGRSMTPYPVLDAAIDWAKKENKDTLQASLLINSALVSAEAGNTQDAAAKLNKARGEMSRNDLRRTDLYTQWLYVSAMISYIDNDLRNGDKQFANFLEAARNTSRWLFQIGMADNAVREGQSTDRESELLYDTLLQEPRDEDWLLRPIETMSFVATPHYEPMERWFEITLSRKAEEKAIGIAELVRRQRFFSALPFGGRLLSLRWVLEAPESALSEKAKQQREVLLQRFPSWQDLSDRARALRNELQSLPISPEANTEERTQQKKLLTDLAAVVDQQEMLLRKLALVREPVELAFPRPLTVPEIQQQLRPNQTLISMLKIGQRYYVMNLGATRYSFESVVQARELDRSIDNLLKQINVGDKSAILEADVFASDEWRTTAREISGLLFAKTDPRAMETMEEIIFVPDGKAWYLPMELLQVGTDEVSSNLNSRFLVRYAPMMSLAVPDQRSSRRFRRSAIVAHRNFIRDDAARITAGRDEFMQAMPDTEEIDKTMQGTSNLLTSTIDQVTVWHDNRDKTRGGPLAFAPLQVDQGKPGSGLDSWMMLPWRGADHVILSGISSGIEGSSRSRADGSELFLSTTALMASGVRTVLISRWKVGGQSTIDLTRELAQGMGKEPASKAWQRALELLYETELDITAEPRVRDRVLDQPLKADHPFFWSGYLLVDDGTSPGGDEPEPDQPDETSAETPSDGQ